MLELLITYLKLTFQNSFQQIQEVHGLAEIINEDTQSYPAVYCTGGDYKKPMEMENYIYFRQLGNATEAESDDEAVSGCDHYITRTYAMVAVAYIPKSVFNTDNSYIDGKVASNIANIIRLANWGSVQQVSNFDNVYAEITNISTDRLRVWNGEYKNIEMAARLDHVFCSIEFNLIISATESCLRNFGCNDEEIIVDGDTITINITDSNAWHKRGDSVANGDAVMGTTTNFGWRWITDGITRWFMRATGHIAPAAASTYDIGEPALPVRTLYVDNINGNPVPESPVILSVPDVTTVIQDNALIGGDLDKLFVWQAGTEQVTIGNVGFDPTTGTITFLGDLGGSLVKVQLFP